VACLTPLAGEASLTCVASASRASTRSSRRTGDKASFARTVSGGTRAAGAIRRYARSNRLNRLLTLTYRTAAEDRGQVVADLRRFFKRITEMCGGRPMVAVIERGGKGTKRLHVHLAFAGYLHLADVRWHWWHGLVHLGDGKNCPYKPEPRQLAGYLAKYVAKSTADDSPEELERPFGRHRYYKTQGFEPERIREVFQSGQSGERWLLLIYGAAEFACDFPNEPDPAVWGRWYSYPDYCLDRWRRMTYNASGVERGPLTHD
jgi:hypothetical protein